MKHLLFLLVDQPNPILLFVVNGKNISVCDLLLVSPRKNWHLQFASSLPPFPLANYGCQGRQFLEAISKKGN